MRKSISIIIIIAVIATGSFFFLNTKQQPETKTPTTAEINENIRKYVSENISALSPVKEQVGGKFFVTRFEANSGKGVVEYEDGHNAYTADFAYTTDASGKFSVTSFKVRQG